MAGPDKLSVVVLISGGGSNLQALMKKYDIRVRGIEPGYDDEGSE